MHGTHEEHCQCGCGHDHHEHHHDHDCCCGHDHHEHHHDHDCCCEHDHQEHHHEEGCTCGCGGHHEEPQSEYKQALTYMLNHMKVHVAEIRELSAYLDAVGEEEAATQAEKAVDAYEKANMRLNMAISLCK